VNLAPGDEPSIGVTRIEAVRPGGVVGSASTVPDVSTAAVQPVVIGIVDTGVDSTHPDINYVGGMNWATPSTTKPNDDQPGVDNHGHGKHTTQVAGNILPGCGAQFKPAPPAVSVSNAAGGI
jgi:subtilisin family serine protease